MYYNQVPKGNNPVKNVNIKWVGDTSKVVVADNADVSAAAGTTSFFYSDFGNTIGLNSLGGPTSYGANQFHFHTGSEHTIDNVRHDLEMHTVHFPKAAKNGIIAAAMGIFFSVDLYDPKVTDAERAVIDEFFASLNWDADTKDTTSPKVTYGNLMMMVNMKTRWSYLGSVTTPPCATTVYWNVVRQIYPIKQAHFDLFKKQMVKGTDAAPGPSAFAADNVSNYRLIQERGNREIYHIVEPRPQGGSGAAGIVILLLLLIGLCVAIFVFHKKGNLKWIPSEEAPKDKPKETEFTDPKKIEEKKEEPITEEKKADDEK